MPLPEFWGGFRVRPVEVELWVGQPSRLHDRVRYAAAEGTPLDDGRGLDDDPPPALARAPPPIVEYSAGL